RFHLIRHYPALLQLEIDMASSRCDMDRLSGYCNCALTGDDIRQSSERFAVQPEYRRVRLRVDSRQALQPADGSVASITHCDFQTAVASDHRGIGGFDIDRSKPHGAISGAVAAIR